MHKIEQLLFQHFDEMERPSSAKRLRDEDRFVLPSRADIDTVTMQRSRLAMGGCRVLRYTMLQMPTLVYFG